MFSRLHLVVIAALALFLKGSAGFHITIVVSVCKETNVDAVLSPFLDKIALSPHRHSSEVLFFCKCTKDRTVSGRLCANLPNVGRESSTYLSFILESYRYLSASQEHVILFINGGSGSKEHAALDIRTMARSLSESNVSPSYIDGGIQRTAEDRARTPRVPGSNSAFRSDAISRCFEGGDTEKPLPPAVVDAQPAGARCPCIYGPRYCETFQPSVCPDGQKLSFQHQLNCTWLGHSRENYAEVYAERSSPAEAEAAWLEATRLRPAERTTSFVDWLWDRWGVNGYTWEAVASQPCGNFGVSPAVILERPRSPYLAALRELELAGLNGGMVGMYLERAWRAMFVLPPPPREDAAAGGAAS